MRMLVDYNSRIEISVASEEQEALYEQAKREGKTFFTLYLAGCPHKVIVEHKPFTPKPRKPCEKLPMFFDENVHAPPLK